MSPISHHRFDVFEILKDCIVVPIFFAIIERINPK